MPTVPAFHFTELALSERLRPWFLHCWEFRVGEDAPAQHHVPPDGCTSLVLVRGPGGTPSLVTSGPWTTPLVVPAVAGQHTRGNRLTPGAAPVLLGVPAAILVNRVAPLSGQSILPIAALVDILAIQDSSTVTRALNELLLQASRDFPDPDPLAATALGILWLSGGSAPLPDVARQVGCSPRTLLRRMRQATGLTPKQQARIIRFHSAARLLLQGKGQISHAAARSGYADQPHFHHEVAALTGLTPAELRERIHRTEHRGG
jgi:AraC-like DNA-binding protein